MSIFDLKTSESQLESSNQGVSKLAYMQVPCTRDLTGNRFSGGAQRFRWETGGNTWSMLSRSYLRMRVKLTKANGDMLEYHNGIAPNMNPVACLYQSADLKLQDKIISKVSEYVPEVQAMQMRVNKSKDWFQSIGNSTAFWNPDFRERQQQMIERGSEPLDCFDIQNLPVENTALVNSQMGTDGPFLEFTTTTSGVNGVITIGDEIEFTGVNFRTGEKYKVLHVVIDNGQGDLTVQLDGDLGTNTPAAISPGSNGFNIIKKVVSKKKTRRAKEIELVWQPPLSAWDCDHAVPPGGRLELTLNPHNESQYKKNFIESIGEKVVGTDFEVEIVDMFLEVCTVDGPRFDYGSFLLDLTDYRIQKDKVDNTSFQQKAFDIAPSTKAIILAYQDQRSLSSTAISQSKFKVWNEGRTLSDQELLINRLYYQYAGQSAPNPDADPEYQPSANRDYTTERYAQTQLYTGSYFCDPSENISDWVTRGAYYYFSHPKDAFNRSTRLNVFQSFSLDDGDNGEVSDITNANIVVCDISSQVVRVQIANGKCTNVEIQSA